MSRVPSSIPRTAFQRRIFSGNPPHAGLGHFLGFDPKSAADCAEVERRIAVHAGADLTIAWVRS